MYKPKVVLISPAVIGAKNQVRKATPPIGMAHLAAMLEQKGYNDLLLIDAVVEDYDNISVLNDKFIRFGLSDRNMIRKLEKFKPDIIGISVLFASQMECTLLLVANLKNCFPSIPIILGGNHISNIYRRVIQNKNIDFILIGEGDYAFPEFLEKYFNNLDYKSVDGLVWCEDGIIYKNKKPKPVECIDDLPFPAFHLYDMEKYFEINMPHNPFVKSNRVMGIITSRGCPFHCYYCSVPWYLGNKFRAMSSKRVIEWIHHLVKQFGLKEIQFLDDNFTVNYKRAMGIFDGIKDLHLRISFPNAIRADLPKNHEKRRKMFKKMAEIGVEQIGLSAEHGDQEFLNNVLHKNLDLKELIISCDMAHDEGILVHSNFMMGFPFETEENRRKTIEYAQNLDSDSFSVSLVAPLPGTPLWDIVEENNLFAEGFNVDRMVLATINIKPHDIKTEDLENLVDKFNRELNIKGQKRSKASREKYRLMDGRSDSGDRKYHHV